MKPAQVEQIAEGRIWDGATALELGLVDQMGTLEDAVSAAADLVGLPADRGVYIREAETPAELLLKSLGRADAALSTSRSSVFAIADTFLRRFARQYNFLLAGDPQHMYSHSLLPRSVIAFNWTGD